MESILPIFLCFVVPLIWTAAVFLFGRWSTKLSISINRAGAPQQAASPYYQGFRQEE